MDILNWSSCQGHIVTGGGNLNKLMIPQRHYRDPQDLPHFYLKTSSSHEAFAEFIRQNRRSFVICGAWRRTVFVGGWKESGEFDTQAFNLQTPSFFIDIRFPVNRPSDIFRQKRCLNDYTIEDLQILSRQHCFAGYTLPEDGLETSSASASMDIPIGPVFTRFHIIDWNYHPDYPRPRPNRWWVDVSDDNTSFKEYAVTRDMFGVPVYYERWERYSADSNGSKYLALRKKKICTPPDVSVGFGFGGTGTCVITAKPIRDALLVVVGDHFACAFDRPSPFPEFPGAPGPAGPALVDHAVMMSEVAGVSPYEAESWKAKVTSYLDLEGSYGRVFGEDQTSNSSICTWKIHKCTHPWREGESLWSSGNPGSVNLIPALLWRDDGKLKGLQWGECEWEVLECSFSIQEVQELFPQQHVHSNL